MHLLVLPRILKYNGFNFKHFWRRHVAIVMTQILDMAHDRRLKDAQHFGAWVTETNRLIRVFVRRPLFEIHLKLRQIQPSKSCGVFSLRWQKACTLSITNMKTTVFVFPSPFISLYHHMLLLPSSSSNVTDKYPSFRHKSHSIEMLTDWQPYEYNSSRLHLFRPCVGHTQTSLMDKNGSCLNTPLFSPGA